MTYSEYLLPRGALEERRGVLHPSPVKQDVLPEAIFDLPKNVLIEASYEDMRGSIEKLKQMGIAHIVSDGEKEPGQVMLACGKESLPQGYYDIMAIVFPHKGYPIVRAIDEMTPEGRDGWFDIVQKGLKSVYNTAQSKGDSLAEMFAYQHVSWGEKDHSLPFTPPFPHLHWHMYGIQAEREPASFTTPLSQQRRLGCAYWCPLFPVVSDLVQEEYPNAKADHQTSSMIIRKDPMYENGKKYDWKVTSEDRKELFALVENWRAMWHEVAACFTDFQEDETGRYVLMDYQNRTEKLSEFMVSHPGLSDTSLSRLAWLNKNVKPAQLTHSNGSFNWNTFARDIHGSLGWHYNLMKNVRELRFAPRAFATAEKSASTGGSFLFYKNKGEVATDEAKNKMLEVQREIISIF